jgi:pSer/pThr/pTyr-binding forkhead associated (FHA) protein
VNLSNDVNLTEHITLDSQIMVSLTQTPSTPTQALKTHHILIIENAMGKQSIPLSYATYSIGRDQRNTIRIQDPGISRRHLILFRVPIDNRQYIYRVIDGDANGKASLNGITVNGVAVAQKDLASGDQISLGESTSIIYHIQRMTEEEYQWYFNRQDIKHRSIQTAPLDPITTLVAMLP